MIHILTDAADFIRINDPHRAECLLALALALGGTGSSKMELKLVPRRSRGRPTFDVKEAVEKQILKMTPGFPEQLPIAGKDLRPKVSHNSFIYKTKYALESKTWCLMFPVRRHSSEHQGTSNGFRRI
jgi:hypothetical protein